MLINQLEKAKIISETPLEVLNEQIEVIQLETEKKIKEVKDFAELRGIHLSINDSYEIALALNRQLGVYLKPSYSKYFDAYTAKIEKKFMLWYAVRNGIYDFHKLLNSQVLKNKVKTNYNFEDAELIKEYKNGSKEYKKANKILKCIELAKQINENFK